MNVMLPRTQMRSHVNSRLFLLRKALDNFLYKLLPGTWIPLYTMVSCTQLLHVDLEF